MRCKTLPCTETRRRRRNDKNAFADNISEVRATMGVFEKLILLYCPDRGLNSRPPAHRSFKHGQGVPRP